MSGPGSLLAASTVPASFMASLVLGQAGGRGRQTEWDPSFLLYSLYLVAALLAAAAIIALVGRWSRGRYESRQTPSNQLAHFRSLYEKGEINQEEFNRLRSLLGGKLRADLDARIRPAEGTPEGQARKEIKPDEPAGPHNPSGPSQPPDTGIKPG